MCQESAVTCCCYLSDCPQDLLETLESLGRRNKRPGAWSQREWPVSGGQEWSRPEPRHYELLGETTHTWAKTQDFNFV